MNEILRRCIKELQAENPRKDYVLGMLETLAEMQPNAAKIIEIAQTIPSIPRGVSKEEHIERGHAIDEAAILDSMARSAMSKLPPTTFE